MKTSNYLILFIALPTLGWASILHAASSHESRIDESASTTSLYKQGKASADKKDYAAAEKLFRRALQENPNDPDSLNMLAFSERKQGRLDEAFENYRKALALRPDFPEAREYLAEAHIQAALVELNTLRASGKEGKVEAEEVEEALRNAAK